MVDSKPSHDARRLKVAVIGKFFPPVRGGMEEYVAGLAEATHADVDLTVIVHSADARSTQEVGGGFRIIRCATYGTLWSQPLSPGMLIALARRRFDVLHLHVPNVLGLIAVTLFARRARLVVTHHADMVGFGAVGQIARWLYRRLLRRAEAVTVLSLKNRELARDMAGVDVPVIAMPVGLDPDRFHATPEILGRANAIRAEFQGVSCTFAFVGRLVPYKGLHVLVQAMARPELADTVCLIVGEGPERGRLEAMAMSSGAQQRIRFLGGLGDFERLAVLHAADVFVLPSVTTAEAFGIVQVEAQLCARPVIATTLPTAVSEVTSDGVTGLLVPPGDVEALASAMRQLRDDPVLRARLGQAGLQRAFSRYTLEAMRHTAIQLYLGRSAIRHTSVSVPA